MGPIGPAGPPGKSGERGKPGIPGQRGLPGRVLRSCKCERNVPTQMFFMNSGFWISHKHMLGFQNVPSAMGEFHMRVVDPVTYILHVGGWLLLPQVAQAPSVTFVEPYSKYRSVMVKSNYLSMSFNAYTDISCPQKKKKKRLYRFFLFLN